MIRRMTKLLGTAVVGGALALGSMAANALTIGQTLNFSWTYDTGFPNLILTGNGSFVTSLQGSDLKLIVTLNNTTDLSLLPAGSNQAIYSFGFGIDPTATGVTFVDAADNGMVGAVLNTGGNTNIPSLANIDICAFADKNCSGGDVKNGIQAGGSDTFTLLLTGNWTSGTITIDPIGFKYQGYPTSYEFYSSSSSSSSSAGGEGSSSSGNQVPEPSSTLVLVGLGLLGLGFSRRMKKAA